MAQGPAVADTATETVTVTPTASPSATKPGPSASGTAPAPTPPADPPPAAPSPTSTAAPAPPTASPEPTATPAPVAPSLEVSDPAAAAAAVFTVPGPIGAEHQRLGGDSGAVGPATAAQLCGLANGGCLQTFAHGTIAWSPATGAHLMAGPIEAAWVKYGGVNSYLAYPTADATCVGTSALCQQAFQRGKLISVPDRGTFPVWGGINATYDALGGQNGYLGYPVEAEKCGQPAGSCVQHFQRGLIYFGPSGTWQIWGAVAAAYDAWGGSWGYLGYPKGAEQCGLPGGACVQNFQRGSMYFAPGVGTVPVWGAINARYQELGAHGSYLGYPLAGEKCGLRDGGCSQAFQRGRIYYAAGAGTQAVWGGIGYFYAARKAQDGALGYPVTAEACAAGGFCSQSFQYGVLEWIPGSGVRYRLSAGAYCPALNSGAVQYPTNGAERVTFSIADDYGSTRITLITCVRQADGSYAKEWGAFGHAGESGFGAPGWPTGPTWQKYSPTGSFTVTEGFGLGNPGTALYYRTLNPFSRWGGQLNANYNNYFESSSDVFPDENMWYYATRASHDYRQGVVINYNRPPDTPITMNAGFAIFLHGNNVPTWGCISLNDGDLLQFMRTAHAGDRFVMGVAYDIFN
ncbi:hypothetical protein [Pseudarthrobacter sp. PH31-O2]|uniref:hypothetical protein n=1 Tax=Pseudarthrobacter sp. PH31-O2 TaxID=3046206 RepID=UPI0024BA183B|nr:hypothetical protein [Pseudarthrobacter sp. PH31-O2]MDJ0351156.1 hypothetical protein [Pseudarthrobacter sp. PH31-O2]